MPPQRRCWRPMGWWMPKWIACGCRGGSTGRRGWTAIQDGTAHCPAAGHERDTTTPKMRRTESKCGESTLRDGAEIMQVIMLCR